MLSLNMTLFFIFGSLLNSYSEVYRGVLVLCTDVNISKMLKLKQFITKRNRDEWFSPE